MLGGYMGKTLWIDLSARKLTDQCLDDEMCRNYLGGYGIGMRMIYDNQKAGLDPLDPDSIVAFGTGPLTGSPAVVGSRFTVMGKSPISHTWGDANSGGYFGPALKRAGYDMVFFTGASDAPVYLSIDNGRVELKDASELWGMTTYEADSTLKGLYGRDAQVACIGPAGERGSLISCIIHDRGRAAARSGFGAVLGSKKVKAIVVRGDKPVPVADSGKASELRTKYMRQIRVEHVGSSQLYMVGTPALFALCAFGGDAPVKNWAGACLADFDQSQIESLHQDSFYKFRTKKYGCFGCPIACSGTFNIPEGRYAVEDSHQPEYETISAFGSNCMNSNPESIIKANDICNRYGLDTIGTGSMVAFAMEAYEKGLISAEDAGGLDLSWGNPDAVVKLTEDIALGRGLGEVLSMGPERAAKAIGKGAESFAIHVQGEAIAMHDPRYEPAMSVIYRMFPGKHIQASQFCKPPAFDDEIPGYGADRERQAGRGAQLKSLECLCNVANCAGVCLFGYLSTNVDCVPEFLSAVTGMATGVPEAIEIGERISNMRQAFNVREGVNLVKTHFPPRILGTPPLEGGPTAGFSVDSDLILSEYLDAMRWSHEDGRPSKERLSELGMEDVAQDLYAS
ncbi:MAG: aldehyde ferredoxin oxidoreductase family protein [Clostridia bacterium]|nr:aldehyde ferredoxin oxidoreductase family protein [Clostridia bacterium]